MYPSHPVFSRGLGRTARPSVCRSRRGIRGDGQNIDIGRSPRQDALAGCADVATFANLEAISAALRRSHASVAAVGEEIGGESCGCDDTAASSTSPAVHISCELVTSFVAPAGLSPDLTAAAIDALEQAAVGSVVAFAVLAAPTITILVDTVGTGIGARTISLVAAGSADAVTGAEQIAAVAAAIESQAAGGVLSITAVGVTVLLLRLYAAPA